MIDSMQYFSIGASWGGFESLVLPQYPASSRSASHWNDKRSCIRLYTGLENAEDLLRDLDAALERL
jgi:cystathionine beta-lyase